MDTGDSKREIRMIENRAPDSPAPIRVSKYSSERSSSATQESLATRRGGRHYVLCPAAKAGNKGPVESARKSTSPVIPSPAINVNQFIFIEIEVGAGLGTTAWILLRSERPRVVCIAALKVPRPTRNRQTPKGNMARRASAIMSSGSGNSTAQSSNLSV